MMAEWKSSLITVECCTHFRSLSSLPQAVRLCTAKETHFVRYEKGTSKSRIASGSNAWRQRVYKVTGNLERWKVTCFAFFRNSLPTNFSAFFRARTYLFTVIACHNKRIANDPGTPYRSRRRRWMTTQTFKCVGQEIEVSCEISERHQHSVVFLLPPVPWRAYCCLLLCHRHLLYNFSLTPFVCCFVLEFRIRSVEGGRYRFFNVHVISCVCLRVDVCIPNVECLTIFRRNIAFHFPIIVQWKPAALEKNFSFNFFILRTPF